MADATAGDGEPGNLRDGPPAGHLASPQPSAASRPMQQTRFERSVARAGLQLQQWARNPWRRLSLQLILLLVSFAIGGAVASISGQLSQIDPIGAFLCVLTMELAIRARGPLLRSSEGTLRLNLLDMARIGLLYGLLLDGFKLL